MVTPDPLLSDELVAVITGELTGGVVAEGADGMAAVQTEVGLVQSGTALHCDRRGGVQPDILIKR